MPLPKEVSVASGAIHQAGGDNDSGFRIKGSETKLAEYATARLRGLCRAAGLGSQAEAASETLRDLLSSWSDTPPEESGKWISEISDDNTPIEFSVAIDGGYADVRVLFEAQGAKPTVASYREAGVALNEQLERDFGADLQRLRQVEDLFLPKDMQGPFALWHSVVFSPGGPPSFKVYLNPQARGPALAQSLVEEGLQRLGLSSAWPSLTRGALRRGPHLDELKYFALDLVAGPHARVKIYSRHHGAAPKDLELACSEAKNYVPGESLDFARAMRGGDRALLARAPFTCSALVGGCEGRPLWTTVYVPVSAYARDDAAICTRVGEYFARKGLDSSLYQSIVSGHANRPLDGGVGMQSWTALRTSEKGARLTVYLSTEATRVFPPGSIPAMTADRSVFASAEEVIQTTAAYSIADHPFVRRLERETESAGPLWLLIANTYEGTSRHFVRWLAKVTANVEDDRVRSLLARQLDQELGEGDVSRAHSVLMQDFLHAIEPLRPEYFSETWLASGRRLGERLGSHYMSEDPFEGLGALMAGEICAEQLIRAVGHLLAAQRKTFDPDRLKWLTQHNELEGTHADESLILARLVPNEPRAILALQRGATGLHHALWKSLDELYASCFGDGVHRVTDLRHAPKNT
jgi:pyrroloquinoline quinone (PQQ) biosynthesis protein C